MENRPPSEDTYIGPEDDDSEEDDDEQEEKEEKPSLFRGLILGQEADNDDDHEAEDKKSFLEEDEPTEDILEHHQTAELAEPLEGIDEDTVIPEATDHVVEPIEDPTLDTELLTEPTVHIEATPDEPETEELPEEPVREPWRVRMPSFADRTPPTTEVAEPEEDEPEPAVTTTAHAAAALPPLPTAVRAAADTAPTTSSTSDAQPNITINNIENRPSLGPAIVGSVIVDQLSRGRDRKLAKQMEKQAEKHKEDKEVKERQLTEQAQQLRKQAREQQELRHELHQQQAFPEKQQPVVERTIEVPEKKPPEVKVPIIPAFEYQPEPQVEKPKPKDKIPSVGEIMTQRPEIKTALESKLKSPEITTENITHLNPEEVLKPKLDKSSELIFKQVETAAEHDIALENQYERRHEVKDVATGSTGGIQDEVHRGVHSETPGDKTTAAFSSDLRHKQQQSRLSEHEKREAEQANKRAIKAGIITAGAILIAIAIWALTT